MYANVAHYDRFKKSGVRKLRLGEGEKNSEL